MTNDDGIELLRQEIEKAKKSHKEKPAKESLQKKDMPINKPTKKKKKSNPADLLDKIKQYKAEGHTRSKSVFLTEENYKQLRHLKIVDGINMTDGVNYIIAQAIKSKEFQKMITD